MRSPSPLVLVCKVRGGVPAELCVKGSVPSLNFSFDICVHTKFWGETFFVDISWWFSRLDLSTGENSRDRRRLLESARVAPTRREMCQKCFRFWDCDVRNFRVQTQFSAGRHGTDVRQDRTAGFRPGGGEGDPKDLSPGFLDYRFPSRQTNEKKTRNKKKKKKNKQEPSKKKNG